MFTYFVVSDIHGEFDKLIKGLENNGFKFKNKNHVLIVLGDAFDRGYQNERIFKFFINLYAEKRLYYVFGNHDGFLLDYLTGEDDGVFNAFNNGMHTTIKSFAKVKTVVNLPHIKLDSYRSLIDLEFPQLKRFLKNASLGLKLDNYVMTHAGFSRNHLDFDSNYPLYINPSARTDMFVSRYQDTNFNNTYIFGHWHSRLLNKQFYNHENKKYKDNIFYLNSFIGIDGAVNLPTFDRVPVYIIKSSNLPKELTIEDTLEKLENN
ncbi:MAG: metallophosphoesterase [Halanaerobiales bacterium]